MTQPLWLLTVVLQTGEDVDYLENGEIFERLEDAKTFADDWLKLVADRYVPLQWKLVELRSCEPPFTPSEISFDAEYEDIFRFRVRSAGVKRGTSLAQRWQKLYEVDQSKEADLA